MKSVLTILLSVLFVSGVCAETPQEGAAAILQLIQEKNYSVLFQTRYSEWHKAEAAGINADVAIQRLSKQWEKDHDMVIALFKQLSEAEYSLSKNDAPQKTETGDVATTTVVIADQRIPYSFFKMKNGLWGFHI